MRAFHFAGMLFRRLLHRPGFLAVLVLIPLLTSLYAGQSTQEAGMVTVALAREETQDSMAQDVMENLAASDSLVRFTLWETPEQAITQVETGQADCAWVFQEDMQQKVRAFLASPSDSHAFVTLYQREGTVLLLLAREKLNAQLFTCLAQELYLARLEAESQLLAALSREEQLAFWENMVIPGTLFEYTYADAPAQPDPYLLSPLRGMLAAAVLLGTMACAMYHWQDQQRGTFAWVPYRLGRLPELLELGMASLLLSLAMAAALALCGLTGRPLPELAGLLGLSLGCTGFAMILSRLLSGNTAMAAALPVTAVLALTACPVFFRIQPLAPLGALLPVSHYLYSAADPASLLWLGLYGGITLAIALMPWNFLRKS